MESLVRRKAIVSFLFGARYVQLWEKHCEANWRAYAARYGYDLILLHKPVRPDEDMRRRPINWQKLLIGSHPDVAAYDDVVVLDADIMINYQRAPCIVSANVPGRIGVVRFDQYIDDDLNYYLIYIRQAKFKNYSKRLQQRTTSPGHFKLGGPDYSREYAKFNPQTYLPLINTGVLVMKPAMHSRYLEDVYTDSYRDVENGSEQGNFEQEYLSYRLVKDGKATFLDSRFNQIAYFEQALHYPFLFMNNDPSLWRMCMSTILANSYFLHFAGNAGLMTHAAINDEEDFAIMGLENVFKGDVEVIMNRSANRDSFAPTNA